MTWATSKLLDAPLLHQSHPFHAFVAFIMVAWTILRWLRTSRLQPCTTQLQGPLSESLLYGVEKCILDAEDSGAVYEAWALEYGHVYTVPSTFLSKKIVLCDPKAIAHLLAKDTWSYTHAPFTKKSFKAFLGKGLMWANGENHRRQRKSLTPAFSIATIRRLTSIFYDSAYKAKRAWDTLIESNGGDSALIEVQSWMNHTSLDTIGLTCFSHDFGALKGKRSPITDVFDTFSASPTAAALNKTIFLVGDTFSFLARAPTSRMRLGYKLDTIIEDISNGLLARAGQEMEMGVVGGKEEQSIIGLLVKGASDDSGFHLTKEEVMSQMKVMLMAGYETMSISLSWALLELSRNPVMQTKLRNELIEHGTDPTYDQLANGLPYLDAIVHETLRAYVPAGPQITRVAIENDIIPLSEPIRTASGELVDNLKIAKGTRIIIPMECINRSAAIWGDDAKVFRPSRWLKGADGLDGIPAKAKDIQGYRHLLTFSNGPRACLGKNFAVTELKVVLAVLVKHFIFELRDGVDSKIEVGRGLLLRPKIAGEVGCKLPLRVYPYNA